VLAATPSACVARCAQVQAKLPSGIAVLCCATADEAAHLIVELDEASQDEDCGADCDLNLREPAALGLVACIDAILAGETGACGVERVMQSYGLGQGQIGRIAAFFSADG
jgi:hypothetical protein